MSSATGLKRLSLVIAAVFAIGIGALVAASVLIPTATVRDAVLSDIRAVTGLEPTVRGEVTVSLFPTAKVSFSDVVLGDASQSEPALSAERLTAKLQLLPLLVGNIEPADVSLTRPRIAVKVEPDGRSNWSSLMATLTRTLKPGVESGRVLSFSELRMSGGTITVTQPSHHLEEELSDVELSFAWPSIARTLGGNATLSARQGAITGFNVEQLLKRLEQRPLSVAGDFRRGRTPFERLDVALRMTDGTAKIEDVKLDGGAIRLAVGGTASIPARDLDLKGTAALVTTSGESAPAFELPFVVQGRWDDPILLPDAQSLIRRSGSAAPLLDAVRDRKTREAVRSVIERMNKEGGSAPALASEPPEPAEPPPPPARP